MMKSVLVVLCLIGASWASPDPSWRVVGGSNAATAQFPFIVSLRTVLNSHTCGGSLIANNWVITAAHCVTSSLASSYTVVAGIIQLNANNGVRSGISEVIIHAGYNSTSLFNDIALLRLSTPIQESDLIKIIPLEKSNVDDVRDCTLIGWGRTSYPGSIPNNLQFLPSRTVTFETCRSVWSATQVIIESEICTYTQTGQGACHGDSGGPLTANVDGQEVLIGLVSWGSPCAVGAPDVYTRVSSFIGWIRDNTGLDL